MGASLYIHVAGFIIFTSDVRYRIFLKIYFLRKIESNCGTRVYYLCAGLEVPGTAS